jgi:predicted nuclease with RNAse H fold
MKAQGQIREVFVGIDVAFAKNKRLPICVCEVRDRRLTPLALRNNFDPPPAGFGNRATLQLGPPNQFATSLVEWLSELQEHMGLKIKRIAIDAPSDYCQPGLPRRLSEQALDKHGISCFATPTKQHFEEKISAAVKHLQSGKTEATIPNANQLWMLVGFALFNTLRNNGYDCIETYPQAIVQAMNCSGPHKSTVEGFSAQLDCAAKFTGHSSPDAFQKQLVAMGFGSRHDKLDAFLSAWVASLPPNHRKVFGTEPNDAIVVPDMAAIEKSSIQSGVSQ